MSNMSKLHDPLLFSKPAWKHHQILSPESRTNSAPEMPWNSQQLLQPLSSLIVAGPGTREAKSPTAHSGACVPPMSLGNSEPLALSHKFFPSAKQSDVMNILHEPWA